MSDVVLVAIIGGACSLIGTFGGVVVSQNVTNFRLEQLEREVREHNNFAKRMPVVEEQIKYANQRIDDLEGKR